MKNYFFTNRLIWMNAEAPAPEAEAPKQDQEKGSEAAESTESVDKKVDAKVDLLEKLEITGDLISPNVESLKSSLKEKISGLADELKPGEDKPFVNEGELIGELVQGLMDNLGVSDEESLNKWLIEKEVKKYSIKDGFWRFESAKGPVLEDFKLDSVEREVSRAVLTQTVDAKIDQEEAEEKKMEESLKKPSGNPEWVDEIDQWMKDQIDKSADVRYLQIYDEIKKFVETGEAQEFVLPFNDKKLECRVSKRADGGIDLKYGDDVNALNVYKNVKAMLVHINSGEMLEGVQYNNLLDVNAFKRNGIEIDDGPEKMGGRKVKMELDWPNYPFRQDPRFYMESLPHGRIKVKVDLFRVGTEMIDGKIESPEYNFVAEDYHDLIRKIKRLENYYSDKRGRGTADYAETMQKERMARTFDNGRESLQKLAVDKKFNIGQILAFRTVSEDIPGATQEHEIQFDWMNKFMSGESFLWTMEGGKHQLRLKSNPSIILGSGEHPENLLFVIQRMKQMLTSEGGLKYMEGKMEKALVGTDYKVAEGTEVRLMGVSEFGSNMFGLSRGGSETIWVDLTTASGRELASRRRMLIKPEATVPAAPAVDSVPAPVPVGAPAASAAASTLAPEPAPAPKPAATDAPAPAPDSAPAPAPKTPEITKENIHEKMDLGKASDVLKESKAGEPIAKEFLRISDNVPELADARIAAIKENLWTVNEKEENKNVLNLNIKIDGFDYTLKIEKKMDGVKQTFEYKLARYWNNEQSADFSKPYQAKAEDDYKKIMARLKPKAKK